jgi:hypothetical protein
MSRALAIVLLLSTRAWGFGAGVFGYSGLTKGMNCNGCHNGPTPPSSVTITGPTTLEVGTQATYSLDVVTGASSGVCVGFDVGTTDGTLSIPAGQTNSPNMYLNNGEVTHNQGWASMHGMTVRVSFALAAPANAETVTLHAWALRSDCVDDESGDSGAGTKLDVNVVAPAAPPPDFAGTTLDLAGVDFAEPEIPDLANGSVDAISSATMPPPSHADDMGPPRNEPTWACNCQLGGRAPVPLPALALLLLALSILRARRR